MRNLISILAFIAGAVIATGSANAILPTPNYPAPTPTQAGAVYKVPWHYEWQYHYNKHGEWVPGWIAVPNRNR